MENHSYSNSFLNQFIAKTNALSLFYWFPVIINYKFMMFFLTLVFKNLYIYILLLLFIII